MLFPNKGTNRPKRIEELEEAIYNNGPAPDSLGKYIYRKEFGLTAEELEEEPVDQFFTNLAILSMIKDKERLMSKDINSG